MKLPVYSGVSILSADMLVNDFDLLKDRIQKTNVVDVEHSHLSNKNFYRKKSVVPEENWSTLSNEEYGSLISNQPGHYSEQVGIFTFPQELIERLRTLGLGKVSHWKEMEIFSLNPKVKEVLDSILTYIEPLFYIQAEIKIIFTLNQSGLETVTVGYPDRKFIGLHVDSWDYSDVTGERKYTRNRISINIGKDDRYFIFCPISVNGIFNKFGINLFSGGSRIWDFFKEHHLCPVYRVRLSPNQAYIAPSENLIHDASSLLQQSSDMHLTFLGYFNTAPKQIT